MMEAFEMVYSKGITNWSLTIVGDGPELELLTRKSSRMVGQDINFYCYRQQKER